MSEHTLKGYSKLLAATHNKGKVREIRDLFAPIGVDVVSAGDLDLVEPEETETTFEGNALLKARFAAKATGLVAMSDDSGLAVEALNGAPGVYSANWAGEPRDFGAAMARVNETLDDLGATGKRVAKFVCVLALVWPDGHERTYRGEVGGALVWPPRGDLGFGYDAMFQPNFREQTFGEMPPVEKHAMSHRASAFAKLKADML